MNRLQLVEAVGQGLSDAEVADRFGVSGRTVLRWRIRYGIESQWTPTQPPHGTNSRYRSGCRCTRCRAAQAAAVRARTAINQRRSTNAARWNEPWTAQDDAYLKDARNGTVLDRALALGRTYSAAVQRLAKVREATGAN